MLSRTRRLTMALANKVNHSRRRSPLSNGQPIASEPARVWPMEMATTMLEGTELYAKNLKFAEKEITIHKKLRPKPVLRQTKHA